MTTDRTEYIRGLRALADALDNDDTLPLPFPGTTSCDLSIFTKTKAEVAAFARLMGKADKHVTDSETYGFKLTGSIHGLCLMIHAPREAVCERVVTGTHEVTREVPDADALAAVPTSTVTETVETVEWICSPLLASVSA